EISAYSHPTTVFKNPTKKLLIGNGIMDSKGVIIQQIKRNDTSCFLSVLKDDKLIMEYPITITADQMAFDKRENLWVTTRDNHIRVFVLQPTQPDHYLKLLYDFSKELPQMSPRSIAVDEKDRVWIGSRYHGVYQFNFRNGQLKLVNQFSTKNGLTDNFAYTLKTGGDNTVWVGTQTGLDKIFLKKGTFIISNISKNNNFFQGIYKIVIAKDQTISAMTNEGSVIRVLPPLPASSPAPPPALLSSLLVNNAPFNETAKRLAYNENNLAFSFAAPSFIDEKSIQYSYRLEGGDNQRWSAPSNNAVFNFLNLAPGEYKLTVRVDYPEALYDTQFKSFYFSIQPPWWKRWWFLALLSAFVTASLIWIIRGYYHQKLLIHKSILERKQAVEKERTRIATDMHDDLGAGLSRIKFLSETIGIKKQQMHSIEEDITKIREYSHEMIDKMGEIVWALNEKNDSMSDLLSYTRSYAVEYLSQNGIFTTIEAPENFPQNFVSGEFRRNVFLAVKETLHNIVKHAQATNVSIIITTDEKLNIVIHDDGIGFDPEHVRPYSNGVVNMRNRMKDINGSLEIKNKNGTTINLLAPLYQ
ncbi:MAG: ATP-binding protein, partial [Flavisolibacter sp.]